MPIRTPRLLIRPKQMGDGLVTVEAVHATWNELHQWMAWAENLDDFTAEQQEIRNQQVIASFLRREDFNLVGIEIATGRPVIWCGFHDVDWPARRCDTGFWVRRSAQGRGFATESTNALLRYAFAALGMRRVGITHSAGNEASRRVVEKLGFVYEICKPQSNLLPGGRLADQLCYARFDTDGLPELAVTWGDQGSQPEG